MNHQHHNHSLRAHQHTHNNSVHHGYVSPSHVIANGNKTVQHVHTVRSSPANSVNMKIHHSHRHNPSVTYQHPTHKHNINYNHSMNEHQQTLYHSETPPGMVSSQQLYHRNSHFHETQGTQHQRQPMHQHSNHHPLITRQNSVQNHFQNVPSHQPHQHSYGQSLTGQATMQTQHQICQFCQASYCPQCAEGQVQMSRQQSMNTSPINCPECEREAAAHSMPMPAHRVSSRSFTPNTVSMSVQPTQHHQSMKMETDMAFSTGGQRHHVFSSTPRQTVVTHQTHQPMNMPNDVSFSTGGQTQSYHMHERGSMKVVGNNQHSQQMSFFQPPQPIVDSVIRKGYNDNQPTIAKRRMISKQSSMMNHESFNPIQNNSMRNGQNYLIQGNATQNHMNSQQTRTESIRGVTLIAAPVNSSTKTSSNARFF